MSGTLLSLMEMTPFTFTGLGASATARVLVAANVDVTRWSSGTLMVRIHAQSLATTQTLKAEVHRCLPSAQDPTRNFEQSTPIASAGATASTAAGDLVLDALDTPLGSYVNVYVVAVQDGGNTTLTGTLSVELALKD